MPPAAASCGGSEGRPDADSTADADAGTGVRARPTADQGHPQLGPALQPVGLQLRPRLLCDRVHRGLDGPARLHPAGGDPVRSRPAPGRPDGGVRHRHRQDGPRHPPALRPDARAEVRHLLRRLLQQRRPLLGLLQRHQGGRPAHPRRRLRARLPAAARGADPGHPAAAGEDRRRGPQPPRHAGPLRRVAPRRRGRGHPPAAGAAAPEPGGGRRPTPPPDAAAPAAGDEATP